MYDNNHPLVSIVVITYNQEGCLGESLDSILAQKCRYPYEIVVADDCSTDGTRKVMERYADKHPFIKPVYNEKNLGLVGNYINAISHCRGKYIAMCDGDDIWNDTTKLQKQVDIMEGDESVGLVYTDVIINSTVTGERYVRKCHDPEEDQFTQLLIGNFITISTACFRSSLLSYVDFDSFISRGYRMQDYPMWLSFCNYTRFRHISEPMVTYLINHKVVNTDQVSIHACQFDENTTKIRLDFLRKFPGKTNLTESQILDAHYRFGYRSGLNTKDRKRTLDYLQRIHDKSQYEKRLEQLSKVPLLFNCYIIYRRLHSKKSQLDMYFGN